MASEKERSSLLKILDWLKGNKREDEVAAVAVPEPTPTDEPIDEVVVPVPLGKKPKFPSKNRA